MFTSENAISRRARGGGLARARFWRALGFPNMALARARMKEIREERKRETERAKALAPYLDSTRDQ